MLPRRGAPRRGQVCTRGATKWGAGAPRVAREPGRPGIIPVSTVASCASGPITGTLVTPLGTTPKGRSISTPTRALPGTTRGLSARRAAGVGAPGARGRLGPPGRLGRRVRGIRPRPLRGRLSSAIRASRPPIMRGASVTTSAGLAGMVFLPSAAALIGTVAITA